MKHIICPKVLDHWYRVFLKHIKTKCDVFQYLNDKINLFLERLKLKFENIRETKPYTIQMLGFCL